MFMPSISFVIPVYNVGRYVVQCFDSVVRQGLGDYEVLVVDDGSTDGSGAICDEYAATHQQFRVVHQENQGLSGARNTGIKYANGKYIYFVDSDDFLVPETLHLVLEAALSRDVDVAGFNTLSGSREELTDRASEIKPAECATSEVMGGDEYIATHNYATTVWWYIIKREYLQSLNLAFPVGHRLEDGGFTPFVLLNAKKVIHVDATVYCYVKQPGSIMHDKDRQRNFTMLADYAFAAKNLIDEHNRRSNKMSKATSGRWLGLANSYIFFGLLRALRLGESKYMINHLKSVQLYPFDRLHEVDYPGIKFKLLHWLMNHELMWRALSLPFKIVWLLK